MAVLNVTPRRTVGITGFDVGSVAWSRRGIGQDDYSGLVDPTGTGSGSLDPGSITDTTNPINFSDLFSSWTAPSSGSSGGGSSSGSGSSFSWLAPIESAALNIGTMFGATQAASQLKPGQTVTAGGTVLSGGALASSLTSSSMLPILLLAGGGLLLVMMMKK